MRPLVRWAALASAVLSAGVAGPCGAPTPTATASATAPIPDPIVALSVNGTGAGVVARGAAVLVDVLAVHPSWPASGIPPIPLTGSPSWASRVRLEVTAPNGTQAVWPVTLQPAAPASVSLDGVTSAALRGFVTPADSTSIAAGRYSVQAVLDARAAPSGSYQGVARSAPVLVVVGDPSAPSTPAEDEALSVLDARYRLRIGDLAQAETELEALVARVPESVAALDLLSDLDRAAGRSDEALAWIDRAIDAWAARSPVLDPEIDDPAVFLIARQRSLLNARLRLASGNPRAAISARVSARAPGPQPDGYEVDVTFTNDGSVAALDARVNAISGRVLQGVGGVSLDPSLGPALPIALGTLDPGASTTVRLNLHVDPGVVRYAITEDGATETDFGSFGFSLTQATYR